MTSCEVNQIFLGEIAAVQNYGAFVRIPGCAQQGLIHKSQVSSSHVDDVGEILQRGERVWCKIISINDDGKISLSMKLVNQGNGTDLDPNGVQLQRDEQKRKTSVSGQRKIIQLQAVLNTTCGKCGTHGHLSNDCFMSPDGKTYELIPEIEEAAEEEGEKKAEVTEVVDAKTRKHKSKKSKGKKKSKKSKSVDESGANDSDSEDRIKKSAKKRAREKKKDRKKEKKNRDNSSQSHSTDDDNDKDNATSKNSLKRKSSEHTRERRAKKCKYSSSKR